MTLTTMASHRTSAGHTSHTRPRAKAVASAPPYEPTDSVQVATAAQAAQAAATPALDPAVQCALLTGLMQAAGAIDGSAIPLVMVDAAMKGLGKLTYTLDLKNDKEPLTSTGNEQIAGSPVTFTNGPGTELRLALDTKSKTLHLDGKLGGYATHLQTRMNPPTDPADDVQGFHTEGTIGGQAYQMDTNFHIDPSTRPPEPPPETRSKKNAAAEEDEAPKGPPPPPEKGTLDATGHVGSANISGHYDFEEQAQNFGATMDFKGTSEAAGHAREANVRLTLIA